MVEVLEKPSKVIDDIEFYNTEQLSRILGTTKYTVQKYFREKKFPQVKIAKQYYLSKDNLFKFIGKIEKPVENFDKEMFVKNNEIKVAENSLEFFKNYLKIRRLDKAKDSEIKVLEDIYNKIKNYLEKYKNE